MPRYPMTDVIARREFTYVGPDGQTAGVVASLGTPALWPESSQRDWYCPYTIQRPGKPREFYAVGVDALQALLLAVSAMRSDLMAMRRGGRLTFLEHDDLMIELVGGAA